jgi:hypothetical protein
VALQLLLVAGPSLQSLAGTLVVVASVVSGVGAATLLGRFTLDALLRLLPAMDR